MIKNISFAVAIGAGLLSFLSPCVLPLIPGYLSFVGGAGLSELKSGQKRRGVFLRTLFFVLGFSTVFVGLGLLFSGGGMLLSAAYSRKASIAAGIVIILFGLNTIFGFLRFLGMEARFHVKSKPVNSIGAFVVGMAFGSGWTPCIGPILASILFMASRAGGTAKAALLLGAYSAGLGLPFLAAGLFFEKLDPFWTWFKRHARAVKWVSGLLLVALGLSMALGKLAALNTLAFRLGYEAKAFAIHKQAAARAVSLAFWAVMMALPVASAIIKKLKNREERLVKPFRLVLFVLLATAFLLELGGHVSWFNVLSGWLLYQGK